MKPLTETHLTVRQLADHWSVCERTVRNMIRSGALHVEHFGQYWIAWADVWACEEGPRPRLGREALYKNTLLRRKDLAEMTARSRRTVDRWLDQGLPTRNVGSAVRINEQDARDWLRARYGIRLF